MNDLLAQVLRAHGGTERWNSYEHVDAGVVKGGGFFPLKGLLDDQTLRRVRVWLHEERASIYPYGAPDRRTMFTPDRIAIERLDGTVVAERCSPKDDFAGHQLTTPWDALHRAYFSGEVLWTELTTPFLLAGRSVRVEEIEPWHEGHETWRVLRAHFPSHVETHSVVQEFFFGEDLSLRRHDYHMNIAGGFAVSQLTSEYVSSGGLCLPAKRRAYTRGPDRRPVPEMLLISIDLSDVVFA